MGGKRKHTFDFIESEISKAGYVLRSQVYVNSTTKLDLTCPNKHECRISYKKFRVGNRCVDCPRVSKKGTNKHYDSAIYWRYKNTCRSPRRIKRNITMDLSFEQFKILINSRCYYCNMSNCRGVDRVDSGKGYTLQNSVPCCGSCNEMKMDKTISEFLEAVRKIHRNRNNIK